MECKLKNLSRPSDLNAAVEGQRREGRRGYEDSALPLMFPGQSPGSPGFPYPLPLIRPGSSDEPRLPMLPPPGLSGLTPSHIPGLNPLDVTRLTLMKMMKENQLSQLKTFPQFEKDSFAEDRLGTPTKSLPKDDSDKDEESKPGDDDDDKRKLVVCIEINSVKYQGILFAQPPKVSDNVVQS